MKKFNHVMTIEVNRIPPKRDHLLTIDLLCLFASTSHPFFLSELRSRFRSAAFSMSSSNYGTQIDRVVAPDYNTVGSILKLKDDTEFYATGTARGKRGVILISDTIGWNSGRIRNIADFFGDNDCLAVIPKLMGTSKAAEGPSITSVFTHPLDYVKDTTIEGNLKPKVCSLVKYMQKEGIEKIALVGFSW
eukprot:scaffold1302_cov165-Ochromonas_danica.AAC.9